jgi:hypothetical protein
MMTSGTAADAADTAEAADTVIDVSGLRMR